MGLGEDFHTDFHRFPQIVPQFVHRSSAQPAADHYRTAHPGEVTSARLRVLLIWILGLMVLSLSAFAQSGGESSASGSRRVIRVAGWRSEERRVGKEVGSEGEVCRIV